MKLQQVLLLLIIFILLPVLAPSEEKRYDIPIGGSPQMGPANAPVTIIEFLDFQ
jgi:hypothetical protein